MQRIVRAGLAGLLITAAAAPAAPAAVTVRAEGAQGTVLLETAVPRNGPDVTKGGVTCDGASAAGALDRATGGDWTATAFGGDLFVDRIRAETYSYAVDERYWAFDVNHAFSDKGVCLSMPADGDELLFYAACGSAEATGCFTGAPLDLSAPARVTAGVPFTVFVAQYDESTTPAAASAAAGATVAGGGAAAATDDSGQAELTLSEPGRVTLVATKGRQVRESAVVEVVPAPSEESPTPSPTAPAQPRPDRTPPVTRIRAIEEGERFERGPRALRAAVRERRGIAAVKLSLTRRADGDCSAFQGDTERFAPAPCGSRPLFAVAPSPEVSYLLPQRLGRGRYVLTILATDASGNHERVTRARNRVRFVVR